MTVTKVTIPTIKAFCNLEPKAQALKPLEEAAEVFGAWQSYHMACEMNKAKSGYAAIMLLDEIADCIQACANLAAMLGVSDLTPYMESCEERNRDRGRYGDE